MNLKRLTSYHVSVQKSKIILLSTISWISIGTACVFLYSCLGIYCFFRGAKRGKIIGTPTGGSTGNPIFIDLGGGIGCSICTKHELDADGNEFIGVGIQPDVVIEEDVSMFLKNSDAVIEKALELLK